MFLDAIFCADGVVRIVEQYHNNFHMKLAIRLHDEPILFASLSHDNKYVATVSQKCLFFSQIQVDENEIQFIPIAFTQLSRTSNEQLSPSKMVQRNKSSVEHSGDISQIFWNHENNIVIGFYDQEIITFQIPDVTKPVSNSTYQRSITALCQKFQPLGVLNFVSMLNDQLELYSIMYIVVCICV